MTVQRRSAAGSATSRRTPAAVTASSSPTRARSSGAVRGPGQVQRQLEGRVGERAVARGAANAQQRRRRAPGGRPPGRRAPHSSAAKLEQRGDAGRLGRGVPDGAHGRPEPGQIGQHGRLLGAPLAQPAARGPGRDARRRGHEPVRDQAVDAQPVQRQRRQRAAGLRGDHPLRGEHQPDARARGRRAAPRSPARSSASRSSASAVRSQPARPRPRGCRRAPRAARGRRAGAPGTAAPGSRRPPRAARAAAASRRSGRSRPRRRPTARPRAARRTSPSARSSSTPGSTVSSSATSSSTPGAGEQRAQVVLQPPQAASSSPRASTCAANRPRPSTSAGSPPRSASSASPSECAGSVDTTSVLRPGPRERAPRSPRRGSSCRRRPCP